MRFYKFVFLFLVLSFSFNSYAAENEDVVNQQAGKVTAKGSVEKDLTREVICKTINYIHSIGGPLMTVVIIGSSILAIFGRMAWPALVALVIFCGVFFGAATVVDKMVGSSTEKCS
ncbi:TrbC/VirB2 family protein [Wolbachia endosymbiont of Pentidionis agamae]|uniref:TrbC/VirB2 family protein n=1 Tax=Wolbachia endosymbiont of Pentidionis agamae TaxID=3110435 RepID=UPI002FD0FA91